MHSRSSSYSSSVGRSQIPIRSITKSPKRTTIDTKEVYNKRRSRRRSSSTSSSGSVETFRRKRSSATIPPSQSPNRQKSQHRDPHDRRKGDEEHITPQKKTTKNVPPSQSPNRHQDHQTSDDKTGTRLVVPVNISVDLGPEVNYHQLRKCGKEATCAFKDVVEEELLAVLPTHQQERYLKYVDIEKRTKIRLVFYFECLGEDTAKRLSDTLTKALKKLSLNHLQFGSRSIGHYTKKQSLCHIDHSDCWVSNYKKGGGKEERPRHEIYMVVDEDYDTFESELFLIALCRHLKCDKTKIQFREHKRNHNNTAATISVLGHNARIICGDLCSQANNSKSDIHKRLVKIRSCDYYRDYADSDEDSCSSSSYSTSDSESDVDTPKAVAYVNGSSKDDELHYSGVHDLAKTGPGGSAKKNHSPTTTRNHYSPIQNKGSNSPEPQQRSQQKPVYNKPIEIVPPTPPPVPRPVPQVQERDNSPGEGSHQYVKSAGPKPAALFQPEKIETESSSSSSRESIKHNKKGKETSSSSSSKKNTQTPARQTLGGTASSPLVQGSAKGAAPKKFKRQDSSESFEIPSNPAPHPNAPGLSLPKVPPPPGEFQQPVASPLTASTVGKEVSVTSDSSSSFSSNGKFTNISIRKDVATKRNPPTLKEIPPIRSIPVVRDDIVSPRDVTRHGSRLAEVQNPRDMTRQGSRSDALSPRDVGRHGSRSEALTPRDMGRQGSRSDTFNNLGDLGRQGSRSDALTPRDVTRQGSRSDALTPRDLGRHGSRSEALTPRDMGRQGSRSDVRTPREMGRHGSHLSATGNHLGDSLSVDDLGRSLSGEPRIARTHSREPLKTPRERARSRSASRDPFAYDNRDVQGGGRLRTNQKAVADSSKTFGKSAREAAKKEASKSGKKVTKVTKKKTGGVLGMFGL